MNFQDNILSQAANFVAGTRITSQTLVGYNEQKWPRSYRTRK